MVLKTILLNVLLVLGFALSSVAYGGPHGGHDAGNHGGGGGHHNGHHATHENRDGRNNWNEWYGYDLNHYKHQRYDFINHDYDEHYSGHQRSNGHGNH
ncbi:hypothetical protein [Candidatus Berkiella aquae]|uniref:Uncharacterized protein n=1 Tax=Candidatus Berkiella aquae TaxID=295108 RepID=A0A0Q9YF77_9GAMM|nr:hypothetical protein [Candidatus Berkiella aquae]MCS5712896.1 hypothetical protein [Candidatus Berkiella aquae]